MSQSPRHSTGFASLAPPPIETAPVRKAPKRAMSGRKGRKKPTAVRHSGPRSRKRLIRSMSLKTRGRPRKWTPSVVTEEEKARGLQLLTDYGIPEDAEARVIKDFNTFLALNGLQPNGYAMLLWCGQCLVAGLGPGSLETYGTFVRKVMPRGDPLIKKLTKALMRQHADFDTKTAPVVSDEDLIMIMLHLPSELQAGVFLMLVAGLRPIALKWLRRKQVAAWRRKLDAEILVYIQVRVDKNAWKRVHRTELAIPRAWTSMVKVPEAYHQLYNEGDPNHRLFWEGHSATALNQALAKVADEHSLPRATSTSFRHAYMNRLFTVFKGDMDQIKPYTLHHSRYVTKAHYYLWAGERPPPGDAASSSDEEDEDEL